MPVYFFFLKKVFLNEFVCSKNEKLQCDFFLALSQANSGGGGCRGLGSGARELGGTSAAAGWTSTTKRGEWRVPGRWILPLQKLGSLVDMVLSSRFGGGAWLDFLSFNV